MAERINYICQQEGVTLAPGAAELLGQVSGGDLRKAVTSLQSAVRLSGKTVPRCVVLLFFCCCVFFVGEGAPPPRARAP